MTCCRALSSHVAHSFFLVLLLHTVITIAAVIPLHTTIIILSYLSLQLSISSYTQHCLSAFVSFSPNTARPSTKSSTRPQTSSNLPHLHPPYPQLPNRPFQRVQCASLKSTSSAPHLPTSITIENTEPPSPPKAPTPPLKRATSQSRRESSTVRLQAAAHCHERIVQVDRDASRRRWRLKFPAPSYQRRRRRR